MDGGGSHKAPPLAKELLTADHCWDEQNQDAASSRLLMFQYVILYL